MKAYLALISTAALALAACSQQAEQPAVSPAQTPAPASAPAAAPASAPAASAPAEAASAASGAQAAAPVAACETVVESNDAMQFNVKEIAVAKSCKEFKITLKHTGKAPVTAMGHNIVITKAADVQAVATDGVAAGPDKAYLKEGDSRVIAYSKLIGGGEETSLTLDPAKLAAGESYEFFCSFPGHSGVMKGALKVQ